MTTQLTVNGRPAKLKVENAGRSATFESLKAGANLQLAGTTITLRNVNRQDRHRLAVEFTNAERNRVFITGLNAEGKPLHSDGRSGFSSGRRGRIITTIKGSPKEVAVSVVTGLKEVTYDVEIKDVPVPDKQKRPEKLQPLEFAGKAPVTLEYLGIEGDGNFKKVKIRVKNHANKAIRRIDMQLHYLDAAGKELKKWSGHARSSFGPRGQREPVAEKNSTAETKVTAFFMPKETKSVRVELEKIAFADATIWDAKEKR